jgi:deazaflavin-dependent oxidoreductase (nitroreductase family)
MKEPDMTTAHYAKPGWFSRNVLNRIISGSTKAGLPLRGSRILAVRGRTSGEWRTVPVNPLSYDGATYLVAPRGDTQWTRNLRVAGGGELRSKKGALVFTAVELADRDKPEVLRAYLRNWKAETSRFFDNVGPDAPQEEIERIAPRHPIFKIS